MDAVQDQIHATWVPLKGAFDAHHSFIGRLELLSYTASQHAETLERLAREKRPEIRVSPGWRLGHPNDVGQDGDAWAIPNELTFDSARPGPRANWQRLDRDMQALMATLDAADGSYESDAVALRRFAEAVLALAREIPPAGTCSFCGTPRDHATVLIMAGAVLICDQCVKVCSDLIKDWESEP